MNQGYVRLWRKSLDAGWLKNHKLWVFWSYCLMKASYKEFNSIVGLQVVHLMPGQFVFGLRVASKETKLTIQEIRTILTFLKEAGNITLKTTNKFSVITVINWSIYQGDDIDDQHTNQQTTNKQLTTYNNIKKEKNNTYTSEFLSFWKIYPKKVGKDAAWKAWKNRNGTRPEFSILEVAVKTQCNSPQWQKEGGQFIPNPATWLNQGRWEDEPLEEENNGRGGVR